METGTVAPTISSLMIKKNVSKKCEMGKITEKMEGGILVRRQEGVKMEPK
jgi:hypothetical protein